MAGIVTALFQSKNPVKFARVLKIIFQAGGY
jgi:hypothetical protein